MKNYVELYCRGMPVLIGLKGINYMRITTEGDGLAIYHLGDETVVALEFTFPLEAKEAYDKVKEALEEYNHAGRP
jgi:hypothetical protein